MTTIRGKATLPELPYAYNALEPHISGEIMELHHKKHHNTYVTSYNAAIEKLAAAESSGDVKAQIELGPVINFHGGGHINHSLFWKNLAPTSNGGGAYATGTALDKAITETFGGKDDLVKLFNAKLAAIQGSGWTWLVKNKETGNLEVINKQNQDPVLSPYVPLLGVDAWEHAYYLQYENRKVEYFQAIWNVINWSEVSARYDAA
ncbi:hypothetical protein CANCADRAFT_22522 [Tortispora caseinolytica NRRL Y-17796]|uniref:Superoxide dismutase n=1 Tax=Tortispora caseinolytica NRRL Y-17796 TaxID=767744 RepID=A0A1E4TL31_9ASCO|nr:hypothetical protein CANCADRAFT_22522 [Tortispora caseinolytica NRRL Y-17796]